MSCSDPAANAPCTPELAVVRRLLDDWSWSEGEWRSIRFDEDGGVWLPVYEPATEDEIQVIWEARHGC